MPDHSASRPSPNLRRRRPVVIDATAMVVSRRAGSRTDDGSHPPVMRPDDAIREESPAPGFSNPSVDEPAGSAVWKSLRVRMRSAQDLDLMSQAAHLSRFGSPSTPPRGAFAGLSPRRAIVVAAGFAIGLLSLPAALLTMSGSPSAAPYSTPVPYGGDTSNGLILRDLTAEIGPRGANAVLSVSGAIRNTAATTSIVPDLRIILADAGGEKLVHAVRPGIGHLQAGQSVHFLSAVAVPKTFTGDVSVAFASGEGSVR